MNRNHHKTKTEENPIFRSISVLLVLLLMISCQPEENDVGVPRDDYVGRGTSACQDWQYATCEFVVTRCDYRMYPSQVECHEQYQAFVCLDDQRATACAQQFENESCRGMPPGCQWPDIIDAEPAIRQCEAWVKAVCEKEQECSGLDIEECEEEAFRYLPCDRIIGSTLVYEECLQMLKDMKCNGSLPEYCTSMLIYD